MSFEDIHPAPPSASSVPAASNGGLKDTTVLTSVAPVTASVNGTIDSTSPSNTGQLQDPSAPVQSASVEGQVSSLKASDEAGAVDQVAPALDTLAALAEVNIQSQRQEELQQAALEQSQQTAANPSDPSSGIDSNAQAPLINGSHDVSSYNTAPAVAHEVPSAPASSQVAPSSADIAPISAAVESTGSVVANPTESSIAPTVATEQSAASTVPPADHSAIPPPPEQPLPPVSALPDTRPTLQHVDSSSSLAAQPPTPSALAPPLAAQQAQGIASAQPAGAAISPAPAAAATPVATDPLAHEPTPVPAIPAGASEGSIGSAAPVPVNTSSGSVTPLPTESVEVKMEDVTAAAPLLKRSLPDEAASELGDGVISANVAVGSGDASSASAEAEREAKRPRVDSEVPAASASAMASPVPMSSVVTSASASPAPVVPAPAAPTQGYDPSAFAAGSSLSAPPAPSPTMSPSEMLNQPTAASASASASAQPQPHSASVPPSAYTSQAPGTYQPPAASPVPPYPHSAGAAPAPGAPVLHAQPGTSTAPYVPGQPTYAPAPVPEPFRPEPYDGPISPMTREQCKHAQTLVRTLKKNKSAIPFLKPVDPVALLIPDYYRHITQPMDLGTVEQKLAATSKAITSAQKNGGRTFGIDYNGGHGYWEGASETVYRTAADFKADLDRIWQNCFRYNGPPERNAVSAMAQAMQEAADKGFRTSPASPQVQAVQQAPQIYAPTPRQQSPQEHKRERRQSHSHQQPASPNYVPTIRRSEDGNRPKREIHAPARDLAYLNDEAAAYGAAVGPPVKSRTGRVSGKQAQEQLRFCKEVIKELFKKIHEPYAFPFYEPVNWVALNIPQYPQVVREPMDLGTVRTKLDNGLYPLPPYAAFERDVRLIFKNCYLFNPPGTPVHEWGARLEAVFEDKWSERPMSYDDEEPSDDDGISAMEKQLMSLQHSIEQMKASKRAEKERLRAAERAAAARAMPKPPKRQPSMEYMPQHDPAAYGSYAAPAPPRRDSGGGAAKRKPGGGSQRRKKARRSGDSSDEDFYDDGGAYVPQAASHAYAQPSYAQPAAPAEPEVVTFEMKRELAQKIVSFEGENLERAIDIIRQGRPDLLSDANKEIELDIDTLDPSTLLNLYRFVCPTAAPAGGRKGKAAGGAGRGGRNGAPPAPSKRKNLDEIKESERIEMLEARLREFDGRTSASAGPAAGGADGAAGSSGAGAGGAAAAGDQASSDSSSEDESGSDSDDD